MPVTPVSDARPKKSFVERLIETLSGGVKEAPIQPFVWRPVDVGMTSADTGLSKIIGDFSGLRGGANDARKTVRIELIPHVEKRIKKKRGGRDQSKLLEKRLGEFQEAIHFCFKYPLLGDFERVRNVHEFASHAIASGWPGAEAAAEIAKSLARQLKHGLPVSGVSVPSCFVDVPKHSFPGLVPPERLLPSALSHPESASWTTLAQAIPQETSYVWTLRDFEKAAEKCRAVAATTNRGSFAEQLKTRAKLELLKLMHLQPRDEHDKLQPFARVVHGRAEELAKAQAADLATIDQMDIDNDASITAGIEAIYHAHQRNPSDLHGVAIGVI